MNTSRQQDNSEISRRHLATITVAMVEERTRKVLIDRPDLIENIAGRVVEGAFAVLECYLGKAWIKRNLLTERPDDFMVPRSEDPNNRDFVRASSRIVILAECLLSMQQTDGIVDRVDDLKKKDLEGCISELQGAMLLRAASIPFRFRREIGHKRDKIKGGDFDVVAMVNGQQVNCEMKAKCEGTRPNRLALKRRLNDAKGQLPKDEPNIVFIRIPEDWMMGDARQEVVCGIEGHFRDSRRVTSVVIHWEEWATFGDRKLQVVKFRHFPNPQASMDMPWLQSAIDSWISGKRANWFSLHRAVCTDEEFARLQSEVNLLQAAKSMMDFSHFAS